MPCLLCNLVLCFSFLFLFTHFHFLCVFMKHFVTVCFKKCCINRALFTYLNGVNEWTLMGKMRQRNRAHGEEDTGSTGSTGQCLEQRIESCDWSAE